MDYTTAFGNGSDGTGKPPGGGGIGDFDGAAAAPEFSPIPGGVYDARVQRGEYTTTRAGADAYRLRFEITAGDHAGKSVIRTWTFGPKALPYTKRDLAPFGLATAAQLLTPFPVPGREYHVRLVVALQRGDDGIERNDVKRVELLSVIDAPAAGFILPPQGEGGPK